MYPSKHLRMRTKEESTYARTNSHKRPEEKASFADSSRSRNNVGCANAFLDDVFLFPFDVHFQGQVYHLSFDGFYVACILFDLYYPAFLSFLLPHFWTFHRYITPIAIAQRKTLTSLIYFSIWCAPGNMAKLQHSLARVISCSLMESFLRIHWTLFSTSYFWREVQRAAKWWICENKKMRKNT